MTSSPYDDEHIDCSCPECRAKVVPLRRSTKPGIPPHIRAQLDQLKAKRAAERQAEEEQTAQDG